MRIDIENNIGKRFMDVSTGEVFVHGNDVYIKTNGKEAVNLANGKREYMASAQSVEPVRATLKVEY